MSHISEEEIIKNIKAKKYSDLTFLEECRHSSEEQWYLGFYYFIQDLKQDDTKSTLNEIISKYGNESSAYCYLGDTASKIYEYSLKSHIAACFYKKSIELNEENIIAHEKLYTINYTMDSYLKILRLKFKNSDIKTKNSIPLPLYHLPAFSQKQLEIVKEMMFDKLPLHVNIQILALFYLGETDKGLDLINTEHDIDFDVIRPYFEQNLLSKDKVISIIDLSDLNQLDKFTTDDYKVIYKRYLNKNCPSCRLILIMYAFLAEEFQCVITHYDEQKNESLFTNFDSDIYYLLAKLYIGKKMNNSDREIEKSINKERNSALHINTALYNGFKLKQLINKAERCFKKSDPSEWSTINLTKIKKLIKDPALLTCSLRLKLKTEFEVLEVNLKKSCLQYDFEKNKNEISIINLHGTDLLQYCNIAIKAREYDYLIDKLTEYHTHNVPTMDSCNILGVCYKEKGEVTLAFKQFKEALNLMHLSKEHSYIIISNYIHCKKEIPKEEFNKLQLEFNTNLIYHFQWNYLMSNNKSRLFKYSPFNVNSIDSLVNKYFYFAEKKQLNDPIELPELENMGPDQLLNSNYHICSLSNNDDSMLMWSHYAEAHQGIMIEYWIGGEFPEGVGVAEVEYTDKSIRYENKSLSIFNQYLLTKNKEWSYEKEVRLFSNITNKVHFENFDYPNHDQNKINAYICSITLGCNFPKEKQDLIKNIITLINQNKVNDEPNILLKEAYISNENKFSLEYRNINI